MKVQHQVRTLAASLLCASTLLAGCGGGGAGTGLPHTTATASKAKAAFTIHWPAHSVNVARPGRSPKFISPSAMAVVVEVNPNSATPGNITFSGQPVIVNHNGTATSTVNIDAPVGSDEFVFTLWDQPQTAGEGAPVGNELGQADVVQKIAANQTNNVNAIIGGITSHVDIQPLPNQLLVEADAGTGFDLVGDTPVTFVATPQDAGGNAIIGPGAPTLSFATAYSSYINLQPVSGNPSQFTVNAKTSYAVAVTAGGTVNQVNAANPVNVVVTATDAVQHTADANLNLYQRSAMYVSYQGTNGVGAGIALYDDQGNFIPLPSGAFSGLTTPAGVAYDSVTHQVFVADTGANAVMAFDASGNAVAGFPLSVPGSIPGARGIAYDPQSDTLFVTGNGNTTTTPQIPKVFAFKASGSTAFLAPSPFSKTSIPDAIMYIGMSSSQQVDDEIAVANDSTKAIDYYYPNGAWIRTDTLKAPTGITPFAAPIVGLAWNTGISSRPVLIAGGPSTPAIAGYAIAESISGNGTEFTNPGPLTSTTTRYGGVAITQTFVHQSPSYGDSPFEGYFVMPDANQIQGYIYASSNPPKFSLPDVLITTPAASGLTNPMGIAITPV